MWADVRGLLIWASCWAVRAHEDVRAFVTQQASDPAGVQASVSQQVFDPALGGSVTLSVVRGEGVCCSAWDWVGVYQGGTRLSYAHSGDGVHPGFNATLAIPPGSGTYTFAYSTSVDSWQVHSLGIVLSFGEPAVAPAIPMAALIPSYWYPTDAAWAQLQAAVEGSGLPADRVTVVLNPNSGNITYDGMPSPAAWGLWQSRAQSLSSAGVRVLAYVNLCSHVVDFECSAAELQGNRSFLGDHGVKAEIDKYAAEFGAHLTGLFFDDAGHSGLHTAAILQATEYANALGLGTVHNPGVLSQDPVLFEASNATVLREGPTPGDANPFQEGLPAEKAAMILHSVAGDAWRDSLDLARARGFKYFYATESWATCPPYIGELLAAIAAAAPNTTQGDPAGDDQASVVGDPHVVNVAKVKFEIRAEGVHKLVQIPRSIRSSARPDLRVDAAIERLGRSACDKLFLTSLSIFGRWTEDAVGLLRISRGSDMPNTTLLVNTQAPEDFLRRLRLPGAEAGRLSLAFTLRDVGFHVGKHFQGRYGRQRSHLNVRIVGLGRHRDVGGLLGYDDHAGAAKPPANCSAAKPAEAGRSSFLGVRRSAVNTDAGSRIEAE